MCLIENRIPSVARELATTDFYLPNYRAVWSAFLELQENSQEIEPLSAVQIIKRNGGNLGAAELPQTMVGMLRVNGKIFVNKILDAAKRRYLKRELYKLIENVQSGTELRDFLQEFKDVVEKQILRN